MADAHQLMDAKLKRKFSFAEILALLLISGQIALYAFMWFRLLRDPSLKTMDFIIFYGTGRLIRAGEYEQIYDLDTETAIQRQIVGSTYKDPLLFNHPPHITPLLALIANDNYVLAYIIWTGTSLLVLSVCVELIRRYLLRSGWNERSAWLSALGSITFLPIFISLLGGQDIVYTLIGLLVWMFSLLKGGDMFAGLGLAFATLSPTIAGALALPLFASRHRAGLWFIVGMLGLAVYSLFLVGTQGIMDLLHLFRISSQGQFYGFNWPAMYNLLGILVRAFPVLSIDVVRSIAWIASVLSMLAMCLLWWNKRDHLNVRHIGIAVILGTFTAPHLYLHGLSYLLLPLLGIITLLYDRGNKKIALILIPVISTVLIIVLFLLPFLNFVSYYLLMFAMLFGFAVIKSSSMPSSDF